MSFEFDLSRSRWSDTRDWFRSLPLGLKLVYLFVTTPAALFIFYCIAIGQNKSTAALAGFGIFAVSALLFIVFDRRRDR